MVIVNTASQCGFTNSNYTQLKELLDKYKSEGLEVAAFPCNQFGAQVILWQFSHRKCFRSLDVTWTSRIS